MIEAINGGGALAVSNVSWPTSPTDHAPYMVIFGVAPLGRRRRPETPSH